MTYEELIERKDKQDAFTLVEALLGLIVLGVVAALTIPGMAANKDRREWGVALNKAYSILTEGFKQSQVLHNKVASWSSDNFITNLMDGFKIEYECKDNDCMPDEILYLNKEPVEGAAFVEAKSFVLLDGQIVTVMAPDVGCTSTYGTLKDVCGTLYVDINGKKGPNTWGKDYFGFFITKEGIIPFGTQKLDVIKDGYAWMNGACHGPETHCVEYLSCENPVGSQTDCETCGGSFVPAYYKPVIDEHAIISGYQVQTYKDVKNSYECCNGHTGEYCCGRNYWGACNCYRNDCNSYTTCHRVTGYAINTYAPVYEAGVVGYDYVNAVCNNHQTEQVCIKSQYVDIWDCWVDTATGVPYSGDAGDGEESCNSQTNASKTSCSFKENDALEDCNIEDKGTSCGAWVLNNDGDMTYLDGKEVSW